jgi:hypothetical protein
MQRIHFTASDLARTRLQSTLGPVVEGVFAFGVLVRSGNADFARWRAQVLGRLREHASTGPEPAGWTYTVKAPDDLLFLLERPTGWWPFPSRADAVRLAMEVWRAGVAPYWDRIQERLEAECDVLGRVAMAGGVEQLLATLHPKAVWNGPVLEIPDSRDRDIHLDGQGLHFCPSVFLPGRVGRVVMNEWDTGMTPWSSPRLPP